MAYLEKSGFLINKLTQEKSTHFMLSFSTNSAFSENFQFQKTIHGTATVYYIFEFQFEITNILNLFVKS